MDQIKTGQLIRTLRQRRGLTQSALAWQIGVSDKAVSKWERGCGAPDISLLPALGDVLGVDAGVLLRGELGENGKSSGNMKKVRFYVCPQCGSLLFAAEEAEVSCCGRRLKALEPHPAEGEHKLSVTRVEDEWFLSGGHPMEREHYISFVALVTGDTVLVKKRYPQWSLDTRLPMLGHGTLYWCCTRHGLFCQRL